MVVGNALAADEVPERLLIDVVAHHLVLQLVLPVHLHGAGDVPGFVEQNVLIRLDNAYGWVVEVSGHPLGAHQHFRTNVLGHNTCLQAQKNGQEDHTASPATYPPTPRPS